MEILPLLRMLGALGVVLGLLVGALWAVRRFQIRLPGIAGAGGPSRRLELVERVSMDTRRSVALVRRDGREHLLLLAPEGNMVIESGIIQDETDRDAARIRAEQAEQAAAEAAEAAERARAEFQAMVERTTRRLGEVGEGARRTIAGGLSGVREGARIAADKTREAAEKARQAAERRRSGPAAIGDPAAEPSAEESQAVEAVPAQPVPATPQTGLFAGLVDEARAEPKPRPRRRNPRKPGKTEDR
jgi:flagellar biogenesis protein FliO